MPIRQELGSKTARALQRKFVSMRVQGINSLWLHSTRLRNRRLNAIAEHFRTWASKKRVVFVDLQRTGHGVQLEIISPSAAAKPKRVRHQTKGRQQIVQFLARIAGPAQLGVGN